MSVKYIKMQGLGELERTRLASLLRRSNSVISISEAVEVLQKSRSATAKILAKYAQKGWLKRIAPGVYMPVPLESTTSDISAEDVMGLAGELFSPCYLSGWTAAEHWGLTEQLFQSIVVVTQTKKKNYRPKILDTEYVLFLAPENRFFGLKIVWPGNIPVKIVDSTRLMLDILYRPEMAGGIRSASDFFSAYLSSDKRNIPLLMDYLRQFKSGVTSKRLGFLAEKFCPEEKVLIDLCLHTITKGYSKLDPDLSCTIHLARWNLLIPENWR